MGSSETEDAGGLSPVKDDNEAAAHFNHRTLPFFKYIDYRTDLSVTVAIHNHPPCARILLNSRRFSCAYYTSNGRLCLVPHS